MGTKPWPRRLRRRRGGARSSLLPDRRCAGRVGEILAERMGLPFWQFTLSASGSNTEVIAGSPGSSPGVPGSSFSAAITMGTSRRRWSARKRGAACLIQKVCLPGSEAHTTTPCPSMIWARSSGPSAAGDVAIVLTEPA